MPDTARDLSQPGSPLVVGVDSSTSACKVIAWGTAGEEAGYAIAEGRASFPLNNPEPEGWEQDANDWWRALGSACQALSQALGERLRDVVALCVTHQRETVVVTDAHGEPLAPALVWMDSRATHQVERAVTTLGAETLHRLSGKPPCTTPSLYKLAYLFDKAPALRSTAHVCDVQSFLLWKLTGEFKSSLPSVDPMGVLDLSTGDYAEPLLDFLGVRSERFPALVPAGQRVGALTQAAAAVCCLPTGLPVISGAGDGQAAGLGAGIAAPGEAYLNLGTALVSGVLSNDYRTDLAFRTLFAATPACDSQELGDRALPPYFLETDLKGGTFTFDWLCERLLELPAANKSAHLEQLARRAALLPSGAQGLMLVPYWNGVMNPYWDDAASGVLIGLRGHHGQAHVYRAIVEGLALEQRLHTEAVERSAGAIHQLVCMGGLSETPWVRQLFCDALGRPIVPAESREATCLGAGILAACGAGLFADSGAAIARMTRRGERHQVGADAPTYAALFDVYRELYPALRGAQARLAALNH
ncbi:MAG: FGGY-family carbohydrate kinase [Polyangiaceae bacterium]